MVGDLSCAELIFTLREGSADSNFSIYNSTLYLVACPCGANVSFVFNIVYFCTGGLAI